MKKKQVMIILIGIALIAALAAWLITQHNKEEVVVADDDPMDLTESDDSDLVNDDDEEPGVMFDEEQDEAEVDFIKADVSDYYGEWEATSDMAQYLYGGIEVTVNEDGTWSAVITDTPLGGTWEDKGDHLHMTDTVEEIFDFDLSFDSKGNLILIDTDSDDVIYTVLTRKK